MKHDKIAFDVDGVLLDFFKHLADFSKTNDTIPTIKLEMLDTWTTDEINDSFFAIMDGDNDFWSTIPALTLPNEIDFDFDYYLSSLPLKFAQERILNLEQLGFPKRPLIVSTQKHVDCKLNNIGILIDDKKSTVIECRSQGINAIFFKTYYYTNLYAPMELNPVTDMKGVFNEIYKHYMRLCTKYVRLGNMITFNRLGLRYHISKVKGYPTLYEYQIYSDKDMIDSDMHYANDIGKVVVHAIRQN